MQPGIFSKHTNVINVLSRLFDVLVLLCAAYFAFVLVFGLHRSIPSHYQLAILLGVIIAFASFNVLGIYSPARGKRILHYILWISVAWIVTMLILVLIAFLTKTSSIFSRVWFIEWMVIGCILSCLSRSFVIILLRSVRKKGFNIRRIIVIGSEDIVQHIADKLGKAAWSGYKVEYLLSMDNNPILKQANASESYTRVKMPVDLNIFISKHSIDEVWVGLSFREFYQLEGIMESLKFSTANIKVVPDVMGLDIINHSVHDIAGIPIFNLRASPMEGLNVYIKACEDIIISTVILVLVSPLMLILGLLVKLSSSGPIFYKQERVSWNNKKFMILKFRSMPVDAESNSGATWAKPGEQRATKFGAFLRKTSLDELPQFLNVLKGDMSIVGPRPERPVFVDEFKKTVPQYMQKHMVKAGITGWAQINGWRGSSDLNKRIEYDIYYIEHWSLWFDVKIIFLTLFKGWINKNAY